MDVHHHLCADGRCFLTGSAELHHREPTAEAVDPAGFGIRQKLGLAPGQLPQRHSLPFDDFGKPRQRADTHTDSMGNSTKSYQLQRYFRNVERADCNYLRLVIQVLYQVETPITTSKYGKPSHNKNTYEQSSNLNVPNKIV